MSEPVILVTGGAGYIGSHTIVALLEMTGYKVVSADNYSNSSAKTYERIRTITGKSIEYTEADLSERSQVEMVFEKFPDITGIIHFAAYKSVPESVNNPLMYYRNNLDSLIHLLETGSKKGLQHFIFSSSCSVYGNISSLPVNELTPVQNPESPYGYTKTAGERILSDFAAVTGNKVKTVALRYFNPVGAHPSGKLGELPTQRPNNLVPVITQNAIGRNKEMQVFGNDYPTRDGTCIRDYVHVSDIAEAHVKALRHLLENATAPVYDIFNLGTGEGVTVLEAIHAFEAVSGKKLNYRISARRPGDVAAIYSDSEKAAKLLNWKAERSLSEMMESAWKWEQEFAANG